MAALIAFVYRAFTFLDIKHGTLWVPRKIKLANYPAPPGCKKQLSREWKSILSLPLAVTSFHHPYDRIFL